MLHGGSTLEPMNLNMLDYSLLSTGWATCSIVSMVSGINVNQHRYSTRARALSCVIPSVKSSGLTYVIPISRGMPLE